MKTIVMLKDATGADRGHTVRDYEKGKEYTVSDDLAKEFIRSKAAKAKPVKAATNK
ncbi:hypothetical protein [Thalassospira sp. UBA1131]|uniref:hypothetical protein n=1 Tax=Thalassospira sp. UBA1131 TaxID=1947672 RepID=UPI0025EB1A6A|nr:hypothetical protein [Thalassospira sp. UBA1131]